MTHREGGWLNTPFILPTPRFVGVGVDYEMKFCPSNDGATHMKVTTKNIRPFVTQRSVRGFT